MSDVKPAARGRRRDQLDVAKAPIASTSGTFHLARMKCRRTRSASHQRFGQVFGLYRTAARAATAVAAVAVGTLGSPQRRSNWGSIAAAK